MTIAAASRYSGQFGVGNRMRVAVTRSRRHRQVADTEWQASYAAWLQDLAAPPEDAPRIARD